MFGRLTWADTGAQASHMVLETNSAKHLQLSAENLQSIAMHDVKMEHHGRSVNTTALANSQNSLHPPARIITHTDAAPSLPVLA